MREIKWHSEQTKEDIHDVLEKNLRPRVIQLDSREKVLATASRILDDAIKAPTDERFVIFIGAASLCTQKIVGDADEDTTSPVDEYNNKVMNLDVAKVSVIRYVDLMTKQEEFVGRRSETLNEYLEWLRKQIDRLKSNPNYTLIDCKRAQPWGGSRSSIITHEACLDIVGEGDAGFLVKDDEISRTIRQSSEQLFKPANKHPYYGGDDKTIQLLRDIADKLEG